MGCYGILEIRVEPLVVLGHPAIEVEEFWI